MFKPPENLLETIGFQGVSLEIASSFSEAILADMVLDVIRAFFKIRSGRQPPKEYSLACSVFEALNNALEHGNQDDRKKKIMVGLWLGPEGVLLGFQDEGDFFKQERTKKLVEARIPLPSTRKKPPLEGGVGLYGIYKTADYIFVDEREGTFYLAFLNSS